MLDQFLDKITVYTMSNSSHKKKRLELWSLSLFQSLSALWFPISSPQIFSFQVPTVPPGNVQAEAVNSTTVRFTWSAPSPQFINGINQGYKVSVQPLPSIGQAQDCSALFIAMVSLLPIYVMLRQQQQDSHWLVLSDSGHICPVFFFYFSCWHGNQATRKMFPWLLWDPIFKTVFMWVTSPDWRSSLSTWLACCASLRQEMVLAALRSAYAPTKTVSVLFTYSSLHITMLTSGLQGVCLKRLNVCVCMLSPRTCRSPELHRNPGHFSQSELERSAWEERHPHRYPYQKNDDFFWSSEVSVFSNAFCLVLAGYRISWEEFNRTNTRVTHYLPNITQEYRVTGLTALTTYTIQVAGMTSKGQGQLSSSTISSGVPPGQFPLIQSFLSLQDWVDTVMPSFSSKREEFVAPVLL